MSPFLKVYGNLLFRNHDLGGRVDKITEKMTGSGDLIAVANLRSQKPIEAAGHEGQLQIAVHFHRHRRRQCVHMKEIDPIGNAVFNDHSLGIALNQFGRGTIPLVGEQYRRLFMAKIFNDHLA